MERQGDEIHVETDEVRGGSESNVVRYVLIISVILAVVILSIIWMTGALSQSDAESEIVQEETTLEQDAMGDTDGVLVNEAPTTDSLGSETQTVDGVETIEN